MKKILVTANCSKRAQTTGLTGILLEQFQDLRSNYIELSLFDYNIVETHSHRDYPVDFYYNITIGEKLKKSILNYPILRRSLRFFLSTCKYIAILRKQRFDLIIIYQVVPETELLVRIAKSKGVKVLLFPWGSDILRARGLIKNSLKRAFNLADFVGGAENSNTMLAAISTYGVDLTKLRYQNQYCSSIIEIKNQALKSREIASDFIGIPVSKCNIVCGYRCAPDQQYQLIIEKFISIMPDLPSDYQLIFLMTYGDSNRAIIKEEYQALCEKNGLKAVFLMDFLSKEQVAALHCVTDLYISLLPTDTGNAFLTEALCAKNVIVTGKWLSYKRFEKFGIPYHLIDKPEDLDIFLKDFFLKKLPNITVPDKLVDYFTPPQNYVPSSYWYNIVKDL